MEISKFIQLLPKVGDYTLRWRWNHKGELIEAWVTELRGCVSAQSKIIAHAWTLEDLIVKLEKIRNGHN